MSNAVEPSTVDAIDEQSARARGGHRAKIDEATAALRAAGEMMSGLRSGERNKRIEEWLRNAGYRGAELPSRWAIWRHMKRGRGR